MVAWIPINTVGSLNVATGIAIVVSIVVVDWHIVGIVAVVIRIILILLSRQIVIVILIVV